MSTGSFDAFLRELLARYHAERGGSVAETAEGVRILSDMFNGLTPHRPGYLADRRLRRAYVHYYLPVNAHKVRRILRELETYAPLPEKPRVLDFGCGPGTGAVAVLGRRPQAQITLVDVVDEALDDADFFCRELGAAPVRLNAPPTGETFDLVLAANVFSEQLPDLGPLVAPRGHLVVLEPALKTSTRRLMEWRDTMAASGWKISAPCLDRPRCPMLEHPDLWCHEEAGWTRPPSIEEIDRRVGLLKDSLKYSYSVVTREGATLADGRADVRVVSNLHKEKGKAHAWLCPRTGPLCHGEVLTRHRDQASDFFRSSRGDLLTMKIEGTACRSEGPVERLGRTGESGIGGERGPGQPPL